MKEKSDKGVVGALMMLMSGIALSVAGFVVDPVGEISDSVLWYVSQALIYAVWRDGVYRQTISWPQGCLMRKLKKRDAKDR